MAEEEIKKIYLLIHSIDTEKRRKIVEILAQSKSPEAVEPLIEALKDSDVEVRRKSADALGTLGDPRAIDPLIEALKDPDDFVRGIASWGLGRFNDPKIIAPLIEALEDEDWWVRKNAAEALEKFDSLKAREALEKVRTKSKKEATPHILIVDDDEFIVEYMKVNLEIDGYQVSVAYDGEEAIKVTKEKKPDLILLDIMMPKIDGWEVCRKLKGDLDTRDIPIIMVSAKTQVEDFIKGIETGAIYYIMKPFSPGQLTEAIRKALAKNY